MPLPSRTGLFRHLEKGASLPTGGGARKSNELWLLENVVFICELYNIDIRVLVELRAIEESGRTDFWLSLSERAAGAGCPWPRKETPGAAGHSQRRGRGWAGSSSRTDPRGASPQHPRHAGPRSPASPSPLLPPALSGGRGRSGIRTPAQPKPPVGLNCISRVSPCLFLFANGRRQWLSHFLHLFPTARVI